MPIICERGKTGSVGLQASFGTKEAPLGEVHWLPQLPAQALKKYYQPRTTWLLVQCDDMKEGGNSSGLVSWKHMHANHSDQSGQLKLGVTDQGFPALIKAISQSIMRPSGGM